MRSKIILVLAIIMGMITTVLFYNYMQKIDHEAAMVESMVDVVVAVSPIDKNQKVSAGAVQYQAFPEMSVHENAVTNIQEVEGKFVTADIEAGEMVLRHRLKNEEDESLVVSRKVKEGARAVSVGVNFVQSISNLIEPEDYVDVVFSEQIEVGEQKEVRTTQILNKARVLAVGRRMVESENGGAEFVEYSSVTLELIPQDAVKLVNASERGNIQFTLHTRVKPPQEVENNDGAESSTD